MTAREHAVRVCRCGHREADHEPEAEGGCYGYVDCWCRAFVWAGDQPSLFGSDEP